MIQICTLLGMSDPYEELLEATIQHLEGLKSRGVRFVPISTEALESLKRAPIANRRVAGSVNELNPHPGPLPSDRRGKTYPDPGQTIPVLNSSDPAPTLAPGRPTIVTTKPINLTKQAVLDEIARRAKVCVRCAHLASSRKNVVFGVGNIDAELMFIGEAPGASEDAQGIPFVGPAGELLTKIIEAMGLNRDAVYIANILKCRPDTPGQKSGNRKPTPEEMQTCIPYLHEQIDLIRPKVLVGLGATAIEGLLGASEGITRLRGNWKSYRDIPLMPTFHPSYLLHSPALAIKRQVWEDMLQVMEKLQMPISEKQKKFFQGK